jgi:hypothetical protein
MSTKQSIPDSRLARYAPHMSGAKEFVNDRLLSRTGIVIDITTTKSDTGKPKATVGASGASRGAPLVLNS